MVMVKDCISCMKSIKSSKKTLSWSKNLENINIISPNKKYLENNKYKENIDKNNDYQDILKLKISNLKKKLVDEIDVERRKYIQDKIDLYLLKILEENIFYLDI